MDAGARIVAAVKDAAAAGQMLNVAGHGSKRAWLPEASAQMLVTTEHSGILAYDPTELVITVCAGTPIRDVMLMLAQQGQTFAFEPPQFYASGTIGGMVAAGISGPARPWGGSVRDAVLGVEMVNGQGEVMQFGGQVMKNVAGYDVSRLMAGSFGSLGVILSVSLRVQPKAAFATTVILNMDAQAANGLCRDLARQYNPVTGTWWHNGELAVRLAGSEVAVTQTAEQLGGRIDAQPGLWAAIADHNLDFFKLASVQSTRSDAAKLWRLIVPPAAVMPTVEPQDLACAWAGAERWMWQEDAQAVQAYAAQAGGWAWCLGDVQQLDKTQSKLMGRIKQAFDPEHTFASPLSFESADAH